MAAAVATTAGWLVPDEAAWNNATTAAGEDQIDVEFLVSLAILPSVFASIAVVVWILNVVLTKYCNRLDPAQAILRFSPGTASKIRGGESTSSTTPHRNQQAEKKKKNPRRIGPAQVAPISIAPDGNANANGGGVDDVAEEESSGEQKHASTAATAAAAAAAAENTESKQAERQQAQARQDEAGSAGTGKKFRGLKLPVLNLDSNSAAKAAGDSSGSTGLEADAHAQLQRTTTTRAGGTESRALLSNLEGFGTYCGHTAFLACGSDAVEQ